MARLNMGEAKDDIHVCILCMRAIMNNKVRDSNPTRCVRAVFRKARKGSETRDYSETLLQ